jgi:hypothetical protein
MKTELTLIDKVRDFTICTVVLGSLSLGLTYCLANLYLSLAA